MYLAACLLYLVPKLRLGNARLEAPLRGEPTTQKQSFWRYVPKPELGKEGKNRPGSDQLGGETSPAAVVSHVKSNLRRVRTTTRTTTHRRRVNGRFKTSHLWALQNQ